VAGFQVTTSGRFWVTPEGRADVGVSQYRLNDLIRLSQAVQVASKTSPCRVPAVPLGNAIVTFVLVIPSLVGSFGLLTLFATIQGWKYHTIHNAGEGKWLTYCIGEDRAALRVPTAEPVHFQTVGQLTNTGTGAGLLRVFGALTRPFQMDRQTKISPAGKYAFLIQALSNCLKGHIH
jgi:hypothetical protein